MTTATTTTTSEKLTVHLSERRPLRIVKDDWPLIANAKDYDGTIECQANRRWRICVRQHADGRTLIYGYHSSAFQHERSLEGGFLLSRKEARDDAEVVRTIRRVAGIIGNDALAQSVISDLPAEEDDETHPKDRFEVWRSPASRQPGSLEGCTLLGELRAHTLQQAIELAKEQFGDEIVLVSLSSEE